MKDIPPKRNRRSDTLLRRFETNIVVSVLLAVIALMAIGRQKGEVTVELGIASLGQPTGTVLPAVLGVLGFIGINALFVLAETAVSSLRPLHVRFFKDDTKSATRLQTLMDEGPEIVAAFSFANQVVRVGVLFIGLVLALRLATFISTVTQFGFTYGVILVSTILVAIPIILLNLILGELVPKSFATLHPHKIATRFFGFIQLVSFIFKLPAAGVVALANLFAARFGGKTTLDASNRTEEEIITLVESAQETGEIESDESELIQSVFEFTDTIVREVMTPRTDLDSMSISSNPSDVVEVIQKSGHSRIPLYEGTDDQIVGIIHAKDLLLAMVNGEPVTLRRLMRPAIFVPESKNLHDVLAELKASKTQLAIVQDEHGGTAGIVTIEDIVEELVGDIQDEYDEDEPEVSETEAGFLVEGKTHLDDVNDEIGSEFESEDFDTIGGYVFGLFGRQPKMGEFIEHDGYCFTVAGTDGRRIIQIRIRRLETQNDYSLLATETAAGA